MKTFPTRDHATALGLFVATFILYLATAGPTLVAFRDAGEMASSVLTLGVLHPTSYPVYSILGHLAVKLPLGDPAYRLNIFSALSTATAWAFLYLTLRVTGLASRVAAVLAIASAAVSYFFWAHALISEMYALNLAFMSAVFLTIACRRYALSVFLFGLGCANRADLILIAPALVWLFYKMGAWKAEAPSMLVFAGLAGLSPYLFLPIRASTHPVLNWNDPSTLDRLLGSLFRLGYHGTLDVLSTSYQTGENFGSELWLYLKHLAGDTLGLGPIFGLLGVVWTVRQRSVWGIAAVIVFLITGPLFIFLGNLPPNPHAVAIMESAYLMPDLALVMLVAVGVDALGSRNPRARIVMAAALMLLIGWQAARTAPTVTKRHHYFADDFIRNTYAALPPRSLVMARSDVPLFTLYYGHWGPRGTGDRWPIAQGLAHSLWYEDMIGRQMPGLAVIELATSGDWRQMAALNPSWHVFATNDVDWPDHSTDLFYAWGLINRYRSDLTSMEWTTDQMDALLVRRGLYRYGAYRDFFSNELIDEYARGYLQQSSSADALREASVLEPDLPYPTMRLAYLGLSRGDWAMALHYATWSADQFDVLWSQAKAWKSLGSTPQQIASDGSRMRCASGVAEEHLGHIDQARWDYDEALRIDSGNPDAHYNLAVLYWKSGDWANVVKHLQAMAQASPNDERWKRYLPAALQHLTPAHR